jgi:hypothetical protein
MSLIDATKDPDAVKLINETMNVPPESTPVAIEYTLDEINLLAEMLEVNSGSLYDISLDDFLVTEMDEKDTSLSTPEFLRKVISTAIYLGTHYNQYSNTDRAALFIYVEDIPFEDLPIFMPDNNDFIMATIFKWRFHLQK